LRNDFSYISCDYKHFTRSGRKFKPYRAASIARLHRQSKKPIIVRVKTVIFNIHDVALLLIAGECSMLAILFLVHRGAKSTSHLLLAIFLILNALIALDTLILWGEEVRYLAFGISPNIFFLFGFAFFLAGPVLYWYTKSLLYKDFMFKPVDALHLLPTLFTPLYFYFIYHRFPPGIQRELALNFRFYEIPDGYYNLFVHAQKIFVVIYGVMCLYQLLRYRIMLKDNYSNIERIDFAWLQLLIGGFLLAWIWILATHVVGLHMPVHVSDMMGIFGNYLIFILINILVFYSLIYSNVFEGVNTDAWYYIPTGKEAITPEYAEKICQAMEAGKLFLNPRLTLVEFADYAGLPPRLVSSVLNRFIHQTFHEFVNRYRVEEAKRILREKTYMELPVVDVALMSGFNSKATFNRFFRQFSGLTPSQYRLSHAPK
jgi:AraC-like DNA-binding protein